MMENKVPNIWKINAGVFPRKNFPNNLCDMMALQDAIIGYFQLTKVASVNHDFSPIGSSGVIVIAESHVGIHTWPELNYLYFDYTTCSPITARQVREFNRERFDPLLQSVKMIENPNSLTSLIVAKWTALQLMFLQRNQKA